MLVSACATKFPIFLSTTRQFKSKYDLRYFNRRPRVFNGKIMPKDKKISTELKEMRMKAKNAFLNKPSFPPSEMYLCVLGNGATSSCRALFLVTDQRRYLFNCGEGTQRLSHEYRMKLSKLDHIFFTYKSWENLGGLLGLSLTVQDIGVPEINIHGPPGIELLFKNSKAFVLTKDLNVAIKNCMEKPFVDNCLEVQYIPIFSQKLESTTTVVSTSEEELEADENALKRRSKKPRLSPRNLPDMAMSYACKGHNKPGHLLIAKCLEQGVPPGPLLGDLKNGKNVTLPSGKIVYSKDVVSEEQPCPVFLVVECPNINFLDSFVKEEKFRNFQALSEIESDIASVVIHFTPPDILKNSKYQEWMARFSETTQHLIINDDNCSLSSVGVHRIQYMLNLLHPRIFSLLEEYEEKEPLENSCMVKNVIKTKTLDRYYLRPAKGFDQNNAVCINPNEFINEAMNMPNFQENLQNVQTYIKQISDSNEASSIYPEVTFLGTGSSIPSKVRNVSAILVNVRKEEYFLMDCGEGTFGQITRLFSNLYAKVLLQLSLAFISHMHADHHLGLIQLLKQRQTAYKKYDLPFVPLVLIGPEMLKYWLMQYHRTFESISSLYRFVSCFSLQTQMSETKVFDSLKNFENFKLCTVPVNHCPDAYGIVIEDSVSSWKLVYSGDTLPCQSLVDAGKNCTILIHEATMEDELADEALIKKHCTTSEAINIGAQMNAKYTILTHFSQRYAKVPMFNENFHNHVGCAFDNMKVRPKDLCILPLLIPALKCLFAENIEDLIIKGNKRRKKLELIKNMTESVVV